MSGVLQGSILGLILLDNWAECIFSRFAEVTKNGGVADTPEDHAAILRALIKLEKCADTNPKVQKTGSAKSCTRGRMTPVTDLCWGLLVESLKRYGKVPVQVNRNGGEGWWWW